VRMCCGSNDVLYRLEKRVSRMFYEGVGSTFLI
jgi:hypothetical protein